MSSFLSEPRPSSPSAIPVPDRHLAALLVSTARDLATQNCPLSKQGYCENCNDMLAAWWYLSNELLPAVRVEMFRFMIARNIPVPDGPWEEVDALGDPIEEG